MKISNLKFQKTGRESKRMNGTGEKVEVGYLRISHVWFTRWDMFRSPFFRGKALEGLVVWQDKKKQDYFLNFCFSFDQIRSCMIVVGHNIKRSRAAIAQEGKYYSGVLSRLLVGSQDYS